ncbi:MAG: rRNA maturation RNase YbeY [Chthoniobacterales bacterium]
MIGVRNVQRRHAFDIAQLQAFAERARRACLRLRRPARTALAALEEVDILVISDRRIAALHRQFMQIAGPTDVLTFQHGEIFISIDTAQANARGFQTSLEHELQLYLLHGLLHLHGYDDATPAQAREMHAVQERILCRLAEAAAV